MSPDEITREIRRLAEINGGKPLGERLFLANAGLARSQLWSAGYGSYSDAVIAAGYSKNRLNVASQPESALGSPFELMRRIQRFPTKGHIKAASAKDKSFPGYEAFLTAGGAFANLPSVALTYCKANRITDIKSLIPRSTAVASPGKKSAGTPPITGYVYLLKHGEHYKTGRTNNTARRRREISLLLPEELQHVHISETDDPEGIEAYWHRRLASKRLRGERFALAAENVSAFKRRRYQ